MIKDLTGQRFGRLVVLRESSTPYISPKGKPARRWVCRCDCGKEITVLQNALTSKTHPTLSCGCSRSETIRSKAIDMTGQRFGRREKGTATPHRLVMHRRASGKVSNAPSMPFSKNGKISDGGRGAANLQPLCLPIFHRYKWQRQRAFGQFCPQLPRNLGGSRPIHFWIGCSQRETPSAGDVGGRPKFGASVVAPVQISRKVQKSPTKKGGEHHT